MNGWRQSSPNFLAPGISFIRDYFSIDEKVRNWRHWENAERGFQVRLSWSTTQARFLIKAYASMRIESICWCNRRKSSGVNARNGQLLYICNGEKLLVQMTIWCLTSSHHLLCVSFPNRLLFYDRYCSIAQKLGILRLNDKIQLYAAYKKLASPLRTCIAQKWIYSIRFLCKQTSKGNE